MRYRIMEIRTLTQEDQPSFMRLIGESFRQGRKSTSSATDPLPEGWNETSRLGMFKNGKLIACTTWHDMSLNWDFGDLRMGGVAAVMCSASERGQGHVDTLLRKALRDMHEQGHYFSGLTPFAYSFYKRYGYGWVGEKHVTTLPVCELKSAPEGRHTVTYEGMDGRQAIEPIYHEYCRRYRGMHLRKNLFPQWWYRNLVQPPLGWSDTTFYSHVYTDPVTNIAEGYMIFHFEEDTSKGHIQEFVALTDSARRALFSVLHYYGTQLKTVTLETPTDDALPLYVMTHEITRTVKPLFMARLVDVKRAFELLKPDSNISGIVTIKVDDPICDQNNNVFGVEIEGGTVTFSNSNNASDISISIENLTQAYWGYPSLAMLRKGGMIDVTNEKGYTVLSKLLPETVTFMNEFF